MNTAEIAAELLQKGVMLWIEEGELCFQAPRGAITPAMRQELVEHKADIVALLGEHQKWLPCSFSQQRLWFLHQLQPKSAAYNVVEALRLDGALDAELLERCLSEVATRHETLRTVFGMLNGIPVQRILPELPLPLSVVDLQDVQESDREDRARQSATEEIRRPFDLTCGPLLRTTLFKLDARKHVLIFVAHHIISDGWSMNVLIRELTALYEAFVGGSPSPLPPLQMQYADFTLWLLGWLQGPVLEEQLVYWRRQLADPPPPLTLYADRMRPAVQTLAGAHESFTIPDSLCEKIRALSRREEVTLFMVLLAAFDVLLYRYTGEKDLWVGSPTANRDQAQVEPLIGVFVNTVVLRSRLAAGMTFRELLHHVQEVAVGAYSHQALPFERLVEELLPKRDLSRNPLFQIMFILQNARRGAAERPGLAISPFQIDSGATQVDLSLSLMETDQGLSGQIEYSTDLFDITTIRRIIGHFQVLLAVIAANPETPIATLPILGAAEQEQLLDEWNNTDVAFPQPGCLQEIFESQVESTPDAPALVFERRTLTYRQLNEQANQLAHYLRKQGVGPEVRVGICLERSLELLIAVYGVLKAGGAYVPLEPTYPGERLAFMLSDAQVQVLLTTRSLLSRLPDSNAQVICLDADRDYIAQEDTRNLSSRVRGDNLIYVIYTSGSTGQPKGAMNTQAGVRNRILWMQDTYRLAADDRVLFKTPVSFDVSAWELFWPLTAGACLVIARPEGQRDSAYLARTIVSECITTVHFVPSMLQLFLDQPEAVDCVSLRRVICSGEPLSFDLEQRFFSLLDAGLYNLYGPTEAAIDVTAWQCDLVENRAIVPIGRPIANTQIYLLDANLQPVPVGVPGELYIGGTGIARGYLGRPGLTAEKFLPDPFGKTPGRRMYRTGDLARYLANGNIQFLGRTDQQVKVRGVRIEPAEIEAALSSHPGVHEAVVVAREDSPGNKELIAYVVPDGAHRPTPAELRAFLIAKLPESMVPSIFVVLGALPLTPNGKLNRNALPAPDAAHRAAVKPLVAPRNELEQRIAAVWSKVLDVGQIGIDDDFFELGGHSFKAIRVVGELGDIGVIDLFKYPTVRQLAEFIESAGEAEPEGMLQRLTGPTHGATISIVCVPYGGGSAIAYYPLARALPKDYVLYAVSLPGHEFQQTDYDLVPTEEVARACVEEIMNRISGPLVLYGHCLGVSVTVELARLLQASQREVRAIFLGGSYPARAGNPVSLGFLRGSIGLVPANRLQNYLKSLGGFDDVIDPGEMSFMARNFRHDFRSTLAYFTRLHRSRDFEKLRAPITFIAGDKDPLTKDYEERFHEWDYYGESVSLEVVKGGHYFVKQQAPEVARIIVDRLQALESTSARAADDRHIAQGTGAGEWQ